MPSRSASAAAAGSESPDDATFSSALSSASPSSAMLYTSSSSSSSRALSHSHDGDQVWVTALSPPPLTALSGVGRNNNNNEADAAAAVTVTVTADIANTFRDGASSQSSSPSPPPVAGVGSSGDSSMVFLSPPELPLGIPLTTAEAASSPPTEDSDSRVGIRCNHHHGNTGAISGGSGMDYRHGCDVCVDPTPSPPAHVRTSRPALVGGGSSGSTPPHQCTAAREDHSGSRTTDSSSGGGATSDPPPPRQRTLPLPQRGPQRASDSRAANSDGRRQGRVSSYRNSNNTATVDMERRQSVRRPRGNKNDGGGRRTTTSNTSSSSSASGGRDSPRLGWCFFSAHRITGGSTSGTGEEGEQSAQLSPGSASAAASPSTATEGEETGEAQPVVSATSVCRTAHTVAALLRAAGVVSAESDAELQICVAESCRISSGGGGSDVCKGGRIPETEKRTALLDEEKDDDVAFLFSDTVSFGSTADAWWALLLRHNWLDSLTRTACAPDPDRHRSSRAAASAAAALVYLSLAFCVELTLDSTPQTPPPLLNALVGRLLRRKHQEFVSPSPVPAAATAAFEGAHLAERHRQCDDDDEQSLLLAARALVVWVRCARRRHCPANTPVALLLYHSTFILPTASNQPRKQQQQLTVAEALLLLAGNESAWAHHDPIQPFEGDKNGAQVLQGCQLLAPAAASRAFSSDALTLLSSLISECLALAGDTLEKEVPVGLNTKCPGTVEDAPATATAILCKVIGTPWPTPQLHAALLPSLWVPGASAALACHRLWRPRAADVSSSIARIRRSERGSGESTFLQTAAAAAMTADKPASLLERLATCWNETVQRQQSMLRLRALCGDVGESKDCVSAHRSLSRLMLCGGRLLESVVHCGLAAYGASASATQQSTCTQREVVYTMHSSLFGSSPAGIVGAAPAYTHYAISATPLPIAAMLSTFQHYFLQHISCVFSPLSFTHGDSFRTPHHQCDMLDALAQEGTDLLFQLLHFASYSVECLPTVPRCQPDLTPTFQCLRAVVARAAFETEGAVLKQASLKKLAGANVSESRASTSTGDRDDVEDDDEGDTVAAATSSSSVYSAPSVYPFSPSTDSSDRAAYVSAAAAAVRLHHTIRAVPARGSASLRAHDVQNGLWDNGGGAEKAKRGFTDVAPLAPITVEMQKLRALARRGLVCDFPLDISAASAHTNVQRGSTRIATQEELSARQRRILFALLRTERVEREAGDFNNEEHCIDTTTSLSGKQIDEDKMGKAAKAEKTASGLLRWCFSLSEKLARVTALVCNSGSPAEQRLGTSPPTLLHQLIASGVLGDAVMLAGLPATSPLSSSVAAAGAGEPRDTLCSSSAESLSPSGRNMREDTEVMVVHTWLLLLRHLSSSARDPRAARRLLLGIDGVSARPVETLVSFLLHRFAGGWLGRLEKNAEKEMSVVQRNRMHCGLVMLFELLRLLTLQIIDLADQEQSMKEGEGMSSTVSLPSTQQQPLTGAVCRAYCLLCDAGHRLAPLVRVLRFSHANFSEEYTEVADLLHDSSRKKDKSGVAQSSAETRRRVGGSIRAASSPERPRRVPVAVHQAIFDFYQCLYRPALTQTPLWVCTSHHIRRGTGTEGSKGRRRDTIGWWLRRVARCYESASRQRFRLSSFLSSSEANTTSAMQEKLESGAGAEQRRRLQDMQRLSLCCMRELRTWVEHLTGIAGSQSPSYSNNASTGGEAGGNGSWCRSCRFRSPRECHRLLARAVTAENFMSCLQGALVFFAGNCKPRSLGEVRLTFGAKTSVTCNGAGASESENGTLSYSSSSGSSASSSDSSDRSIYLDASSDSDCSSGGGDDNSSENGSARQVWAMPRRMHSSSSSSSASSSSSSSSFSDFSSSDGSGDILRRVMSARGSGLGSFSVRVGTESADDSSNASAGRNRRGAAHGRYESFSTVESLMRFQQVDLAELGVDIAEYSSEEVPANSYGWEFDGYSSSSTTTSGGGDNNTSSSDHSSGNYEYDYFNEDSEDAEEEAATPEEEEEGSASPRLSQTASLDWQVHYSRGDSSSSNSSGNNNNNNSAGGGGGWNYEDWEDAVFVRPPAPRELDVTSLSQEPRVPLPVTAQGRGTAGVVTSGGAEHGRGNGDINDSNGGVALPAGSHDFFFSFSFDNILPSSASLASLSLPPSQQSLSAAPGPESARRAAEPHTTRAPRSSLPRRHHRRRDRGSIRFSRASAGSESASSRSRSSPMLQRAGPPLNSDIVASYHQALRDSDRYAAPRAGAATTETTETASSSSSTSSPSSSVSARRRRRRYFRYIYPNRRPQPFLRTEEGRSSYSEENSQEGDGAGRRDMRVRASDSYSYSGGVVVALNHGRREEAGGDEPPRSGSTTASDDDGGGRANRRHAMPTHGGEPSPHSNSSSADAPWERDSAASGRRSRRTGSLLAQLFRRMERQQDNESSTRHSHDSTDGSSNAHEEGGGDASSSVVTAISASGSSDAAAGSLYHPSTPRRHGQLFFGSREKRNKRIKAQPSESDSGSPAAPTVAEGRLQRAGEAAAAVAAKHCREALRLLLSIHHGNYALSHIGVVSAPGGGGGEQRRQQEGHGVQLRETYEGCRCARGSAAVARPTPVGVRSRRRKRQRRLEAERAVALALINFTASGVETLLAERLEAAAGGGAAGVGHATRGWDAALYCVGGDPGRAYETAEEVLLASAVLVWSRLWAAAAPLRGASPRRQRASCQHTIHLAAPSTSAVATLAYTSAGAGPRAYALPPLPLLRSLRDERPGLPPAIRSTALSVAHVERVLQRYSDVLASASSAASPQRHRADPPHSPAAPSAAALHGAPACPLGGFSGITGAAALVVGSNVEAVAARARWSRPVRNGYGADGAGGGADPLHAEGDTYNNERSRRADGGIYLPLPEHPARPEAATAPPHSLVYYCAACGAPDPHRCARLFFPPSSPQYTVCVARDALRCVLEMTQTE